MNPLTIKAVWGFNGTERPGAVYLASVLATHAQKGLPAFGIYGHEVQEADDTTIPQDVQEKILRFARAAVAVATMRGKSYLQIGSVTMGIGGSIISPEFFEEYLGMRVESVDEVEIIRRMEKGIYDEKEYRKALKWVKEKCKPDFDKNPKEMQKTSAEKEKDWEFTAKMACIIKDLYNGNKNLPTSCEEEAVGHNAIVGGFQGQRQWTDFYPNCDFPESILNSSFDWNGAREPYILGTENDTLNATSMLFMKLLTGRAQMFADVMNTPVQTLEADETGALGCAIAVAAATGAYKSLDEAIEKSCLIHFAIKHTGSGSTEVQQTAIDDEETQKSNNSSFQCHFMPC